MALQDQVMLVVDQSALYREKGITKEEDDNGTGCKWTHVQTEHLISIMPSQHNRLTAYSKDDAKINLQTMWKLFFFGSANE